MNSKRLKTAEFIRIRYYVFLSRLLLCKAFKLLTLKLKAQSLGIPSVWVVSAKRLETQRSSSFCIIIMTFMVHHCTSPLIICVKIFWVLTQFFTSQIYLYTRYFLTATIFDKLRLNIQNTAMNMTELVVNLNLNVKHITFKFVKLLRLTG